MSLAARSSPSLACRPYHSTPPENGSTAPTLIGSAEFAPDECAIAAQQISQANRMLLFQREFIKGPLSLRRGKIAVRVAKGQSPHRRGRFRQSYVALAAPLPRMRAV